MLSKTLGAGPGPGHCRWDTRQHNLSGGCQELVGAAGNGVGMGMCVWSMRDPECLLSQVCQVSAQQPVQTELLMRYHQLQSRLATLKIENEEVRGWLCGQHC